MDSKHPPPLAHRLIRWALPEDRRDDITGDLDEVFRRRSHEQGRLRARLWYWREALMFSGRFLTERFREGSGQGAGSGGQMGPNRPARPGVAKPGGLPFGISLLDLKLGVRMLFKYPGITLVGTFAMAVAIAIVAGFHAFAQGVLYSELPFPEGERVVAIWNVDVSRGGRGTQTLGDMVTWRESLESIQDVGAFTTRTQIVFTADGQTLSVAAAQITPSAFRMLRVPPHLGRPLVADDERPGGPAVALLGFDLWQSGFEADTTIVGKTIRLGGVPHTVVGVMPSEFRFPQNQELWTPIRVPGSDVEPGGGSRVSFSIGRLAPGVTLEEAEVELQGVGSRLAADHPETHAQLRPQIATYGRSVFAGEALAVTLLNWAQIMVVIVLIIAGVNVGTLVYARSAAREGEISVRNALGASRTRIALQMFAEALVLASLAAAVGIGIVVWGLNELMTLMTLNYGGLPFWWEVTVGPSTVLLVVGLILLAAVLTGVLPALKMTGRRMQSGLQRAGSGSSGLHFGKGASAVVVTQVAISVTLLTMQGSELETLVEDQAFDDGIAREEYLAAELRVNREPSTSDPNNGQGVDVARNIETWRELRRRVSLEPGVLGTTFGTSLPGRVPSRTIIEAEGIARYLFSVFWIEPNYFDVLGVPVRVGRAFDAGDLTDAEAGVAIVNDAFVRSVFAGGEPIGQRIRVDPRNSRSSGQWVEIVGVAPDLAMDLATRIGAAPAIYMPLVTGADRIYLVVHVRDEPSQFGGRLRAIVGGLDPALVLGQPRTLGEILDARVALVGLIRLGIGLLVLAALMLSTIGIYALMSFTVSQRTREIGIRTALGAHPRRVVGDVFSRAIRQLALGTFLGLALGYGATGGRLFEQGARPVVGIAALILIMGLIACGKPMSRALRIQPTEALREGG